MEKKDYCKVVLYSFLAVSLAACGDAENIVGTWVQPVPGLPEMQQGFVLEAGGKASSVNMATLQYETWQHHGKSLILSGKSMGNHQVIEFSDTLIIEKLTSDSLILKKGQLTLRYSASQITPAGSTCVMKGRLIIGPEVRSFVPEGEDEAFWVVDKSGELYQAYDKALELNPENMGVLNNYAYYLSVEKKQLDKAEQMNMDRRSDGDYKKVASFVAVQIGRASCRERV